MKLKHLPELEIPGSRGEAGFEKTLQRSVKRPSLERLLLELTE